MKNIRLTLACAVLFLSASCGGGSNNAQKSAEEKSAPETVQSEQPKELTAEEKLANKGIGPVTSVTLSEQIDVDLAKKGEELFKGNCTACHKPTKKFIGPAPKGVLERRSPEWVMNMILNPGEMVKKDPIAMQLLKEANGAPMADQNMTQEQARAILEYFRTIK